MVSLGSLCTGCMLMIQHCYTGGCIKRKTNGSLQFSVIACSGVAKGGPSRARPDQSFVVPYQMMLNYLPLNTCTYR